jgi:hypothetical protein
MLEASVVVTDGSDWAADEGVGTARDGRWEWESLVDRQSPIERRPVVEPRSRGERPRGERQRVERASLVERRPLIERRATAAELGDRIAEQAFHLDAAMHRLLADVREFDRGGYWADEGAVSCAAWLSWRVGWTPGTGREHVRVARALGTLPLIDAALASGQLSYSKVRAITRVATPETEAQLLEDALHSTAAQLELVCRKLGVVQRLNARSVEELRAQRTVSRWTRDDGMVVIQAVLPPDEAALVYAAIEREAAQLMTDRPGADEPERAGDVSAGTCGGVKATFDRADGLVAMSHAVLRGDAPERSPVEVVLTIPRSALVTAPAPDEVGGEGLARESEVGTFADGSCVSAETARRLACDCGTVELHEDTEGRSLSVGRRQRTIPAAIARALARRDATCRFPGCTNRRFLDGHHLVHWIDGGETALDNLARLCGRHHRFVHEHGYRVEWRGGELVFFDAAGQQVLPEPPRSVRGPLGWAAIRRTANDASVAIDPMTGKCRWDGGRPDYEWIVDRLAHAQFRRAQA